jgi:hypothetical protein
MSAASQIPTLANEVTVAKRQPRNQAARETGRR